LVEREQNCRTQNHKPDKILQADRNMHALKIHDALLLHGEHGAFYLPADKPEAAGEQKSA